MFPKIFKNKERECDCCDEIKSCGEYYFKGDFFMQKPYFLCDECRTKHDNKHDEYKKLKKEAHFCLICKS